MRRFDRIEPIIRSEACAVIANDDDAKVIAGGTALLILIKHGIFLPRTLVNLKTIKNAGAIGYAHQGGLRIGALANSYDFDAPAAPS